ncbi:MAG TPA: cupin domain-containing protein [Thermoanaerobaculia bacterium]|nr:cupin domain-containing protein [Thermoanaerobaculia bacterium]
MTFRKVLAVVAVAASALAAAAAQTPAHPHVMQSVAEAKWGPAPPFLPPGAEIAVLSGNPMGTDSYSVRLKFPAGYNIPAHSHPTDENVVVVSGAVFMGLGDKLDRQAGHSVGAGGFFIAPAGVNHFAYTKEATTIVLYGVGPVQFNYVNPADDPRNAAKK